MTIIQILDILGTFFFAISGALAADEKKLDAFGVTFIAFVTALGGGTTRDIILDIHPLSWIQNNNYLIVIALAVVFTYFFKSYILPLRKTFFLFDTIGIGLFTIMGMKKAIEIGQVTPTIGVIMGMVSAVFGGVIRDVFCNEIPLIFRKEIYAIACLSGAALYLIINSFLPDNQWNVWLGVSVIIVIRVIAVKFKLSLPWRSE